MTTYSPPVKISGTGKGRTHTQTRTVSQVKVMDLKNVLISSLYNTISILPPFWKMLCVCVYVCVRACVCVHGCMWNNELIVLSKCEAGAESQGGN